MEELLDLYSQVMAMSATLECFSLMGACLLNDGVCPSTNTYVHDYLVFYGSRVADPAKTLETMNRLGYVVSGVPTKSGVSGVTLALVVCDLGKTHLIIREVLTRQQSQSIHQS